MKLIIALDFNNLSVAWNLIEQLDPNQCALKVGSEMFTLFGMEFVRNLISKQFKVFLDLKFHDIPNTVIKACSAAADNGVWMLTVHAAGGQKMMNSVKETMIHYGSSAPIIVAVTILTSMEQAELISLGIQNSLKDQVKTLTQLAYDSGCDGVVSSALEVPLIKKQCGSSFICVSPGIRRACDTIGDQKRIVTPQDALVLGSDYIVVGRPVTQAQNPSAAIKDFLILGD